MKTFIYFLKDWVISIPCLIFGGLILYVFITLIIPILIETGGMPNKICLKKREICISRGMGKTACDVELGNCLANRERK